MRRKARPGYSSGRKQQDLQMVSLAIGIKSVKRKNKKNGWRNGKPAAILLRLLKLLNMAQNPASSLTDSSERHEAPRLVAGFLDHVYDGLFCYCATALLVVVAVVLGHDYLKQATHAVGKRGDILEAFANWDGKWYREILTDGYSYRPGSPSNVAFFPAYPLLGRGVARLTGVSSNVALLIVSHFCLATMFIALAAYVQQRLRTGRPSLARGGSGADVEQPGPWVLLAAGLWPTTFFFRMAYSESLFVLIAVIALYGMERRWPAPVLAVIVSLGAMVRPVGVALLGPLAMHLWTDFSPSVDRRKTIGTKLVRLTVYLALASSGLLAYMAYQWVAFDDPLAFAKTQEYWRVRPAVSLGEKISSLITLEPFWSVFDPSSPCYWGMHDRESNPLFSFHLANPIYFLFTVGLIALGACKHWLNAKEVVLAASLLFIPYVTRSHEMCMGGMGRFAAVAFPQYLVLGRLLCRLPAPAAALVLAFSAFLLGTYSALFAASYRLF
jgi:hypothetical protein